MHPDPANGRRTDPVPSVNNAAARGRWVACPECDLLVEIPEMGGGQIALCPNCRARLGQGYARLDQKVVATGTAALIMLFCALPFTFVSFASHGIRNATTLADTLKVMLHFNWAALSLLLELTIVGLPALFVVLMMVVHSRTIRVVPEPLARLAGRLVFQLKPWVMSEVFLIAVLVSLVKLMSMADVGLGPSFWAFTVFTLLLVRCMVLLDRHQFWQRIADDVDQGIAPAVPTRARSLSATACHCCTHLVVGRRCPRCGSTAHLRQPQSLQKVMALLVCAVVFYVPANTLPIMTTTWLGATEPSTIIGGVVLLWQMGSYPVAIIIFIASVLVPIGKILTLVWLCWSVTRRHTRGRLTRAKMYRITEFIGRWSMLDVFVVAILVALVQQGRLMAFSPGAAAVFFAAVVILTMIAAELFDPRLIWDPGAAASDEH